MKQPLSALQVVAVRYRSTILAVDDERCLDAFAASGVYGAAGVSFDVVEPRFPEVRRTGEESRDAGVMGGEIANIVAQARREGKAIVMTGGSCLHVTGVVGGLQDAHGAAARIGLVWFDAHGDFNTPKTTLTGSLGGMPVAVCAGLAYPEWREGSHIVAPLPTDRIVQVDVRNLDEAEERLIRATDVVIAAPAPGFPGADLAQTIADLAAKVDMIYLHVDHDILDAAYTPNHRTAEPNGPDMAQTLAAIDTVMATGKVVAFALVSVYGKGEGAEKSVASGIELLHGALTRWKQYGTTDVPVVG